MGESVRTDRQIHQFHLFWYKIYDSALKFFKVVLKHSHWHKESIHMIRVQIGLEVKKVVELGTCSDRQMFGMTLFLRNEKFQIL